MELQWDDRSIGPPCQGPVCVGSWAQGAVVLAALMLLGYVWEEGVLPALPSGSGWVPASWLSAPGCPALLRPVLGSAVREEATHAPR